MVLDIGENNFYLNVIFKSWSYWTDIQFSIGDSCSVKFFDNLCYQLEKQSEAYQFASFNEF